MERPAQTDRKNILPSEPEVARNSRKKLPVTSGTNQTGIPFRFGTARAGDVVALEQDGFERVRDAGLI